MRIVFFTGAGISAESGIKTFRDADGLWENHRIEEVATPEAFAKNPELVLHFYNVRRRQMYDVEPNGAHFAIAELQNHHHIEVITQNIDNLHERAGTRQVLHLHGQLDYARSSISDELLVPLQGRDIKLGDRAADGSQLRPHVVWFGEAVPMLEKAIPIIQSAEILVIVGTSLQVYPAAGLIEFTSPKCELIYIDPNAFQPPGMKLKVELIQKNAVEGIEAIKKRLLG
jgi:NAD-dependent deacetylase